MHFLAAQWWLPGGIRKRYPIVVFESQLTGSTNHSCDMRNSYYCLPVCFDWSVVLYIAASCRHRVGYSGSTVSGTENPDDRYSTFQYELIRGGTMMLKNWCVILLRYGYISVLALVIVWQVRWGWKRARRLQQWDVYSQVVLLLECWSTSNARVYVYQ